MCRFVFLDRDGTLVRDSGYVHRVEDYELLPGVPQALQLLSRAGFRLAIVTNQSGIGRGYYSFADFENFQQRLIDDLSARGVRIERTYFCPHHPREGCGCRKPAPEMLFRAQRELGADLARSWVIGDSPTDLGLSRLAGCKGAVLVGRESMDIERAARIILADDPAATLT